MTPLPHGATIGILGGGQLGRMLAMAAARLGYRTHVFAQAPAPAADVATRWTQAPYSDAVALDAFARDCDVVTSEFENVPLGAIAAVSKVVPVFPDKRAMSIAQDRLREKDFLTGIGLRCARYRDVPSERALHAILADLGPPAILKTRSMGYDGKGQVTIRSMDEAAEAYAGMKGAPAILEERIAFEREISVVVARGQDGQKAIYPPSDNVHRNGILRESTVPSTLPSARLARAMAMARTVAKELDYVGVLAVEMFVSDDGIRVNEIAPRVHNSGHWTQAGCATDQFEQHIRAICGLPLGDERAHLMVRMQNLIGDDIDQLPEILKQPDAQVHLYGKDEARPGRKMGHVNWLSYPTIT
ncbi:5-(carboxyamino)imidazole ribonucleotide synthase [Jannaschia sp. LMIT008]|uniref:5-(carboxyamino)imidazole ribonucleotide synthase n=1 Tax=Jannaschia maritima TaxID=3032585 RepID=UPI002810D033|nr:5-(carboxyamino)imidazole ribonucleotide synthase [Jannaschia sp. LMIT008]